MKKIFMVAICLSLAACGGGGSSNQSPNTNNSSSSVASSVKVVSSSSSVRSSSSSSLSSVSHSSSSLRNGPLAVGAGTFSTRISYGDTYLINETTGVLTLQGNALENKYLAADIDPTGMVIAVSVTGTNVDEIDFIKGTARTLFNAPEELSAIAVGSDGVIVCISKNSEFKKHQIYRFNNTGLVLSKIAIDEYSANGIDFDTNGVLHAVNFDGLFKLNPVTGVFQLVSSTPFPLAQSDIDIDSNNVLRLIDSGGLKRFSVSNGMLLETTVLQFDYFAFSPLVHR
jgi:hypothetical protein